MHSNRNNPFGFIWLIFIFLFVFGGSGIFAIFPLFIIMAVVMSIAGIVKSSNKSQNSYNSSSTYGRSYNKSKARGNSRFSPAQLSKVNVYLRRYFQSNASLSVLADIDLRIHGRSYNSLASLDAYRNGTYVCSLNDFGRRYPDMYNQILSVLVSRAESGTSNSDIFDAEVVKPETETKKAETPKQEEKKKEVNAQDFLNEINTLNEDIPDKEISDGLFETCALLKQISSLETKFPASRDKLEKLYQHYLPILISVLKQYDNLQVAKTDPNYAPTRDKLEKTIHLINQAMKTIISSLTDSDFINLSADLSTLEAVLQKDGLAGENRMNKMQEQTGNSSDSDKTQAG